MLVDHAFKNVMCRIFDKEKARELFLRIFDSLNILNMEPVIILKSEHKLHIK